MCKLHIYLWHAPPIRHVCTLNWAALMLCVCWAELHYTHWNWQHHRMELNERKEVEGALECTCCTVGHASVHTDKGTIRKTLHNIDLHDNLYCVCVTFWYTQYKYIYSTCQLNKQYIVRCLSPTVQRRVLTRSLRLMRCDFSHKARAACCPFLPQHERFLHISGLHTFIRPPT